MQVSLPNDLQKDDRLDAFYGFRSHFNLSGITQI